MMRRHYAAVIATGLVTLTIAIALVFLLPMSMGAAPEGLHTPILAFELARTTGEIETLFGAPGSEERAQWVAAMDRGNTLDFVFLVAYGAVLFLVSRTLRRERDARSREPDDAAPTLPGAVAPVPTETVRTAPSLGERLAFVAPLADVFENVQLFAITGSLGGDYAEPLGRLVLFTWIKWCALALVMATWIPSLWRFGRVGRVAAFSIAITALATAVAVVLRGVAAEVMSLGVAISLFFVLVFAIVRFRARA